MFHYTESCFYYWLCFYHIMRPFRHHPEANQRHPGILHSSCSSSGLRAFFTSHLTQTSCQKVKPDLGEASNSVPVPNGIHRKVCSPQDVDSCHATRASTNHIILCKSWFNRVSRRLDGALEGEDGLEMGLIENEFGTSLASHCLGLRLDQIRQC